MKRILFLSLLLPILLACNAQSTSDTGVASPVTHNTDVDSLDYDIGMMLMVGFRGALISNGTSHDIVKAIRDSHIGSVILFDYDAPTGQRGRNIRNADQVRLLCRQLRRYNPQLIIGIDQEGGRVSRLAERYGFPHFASASYCAASGDDTLRHYAHLTATTLSSLGINLNFAPVADVNINPDCPVIGRLERSFSADAAEVAHCCRLWIEEQTSEGVASCMKHFPGHGSADGDTHRGLVDVSDSWQREELEPYRVIPEGAMVMTAHVVNRQLDPSGLPASLSPVITSYLRDSLAFDGVIITDDLAMGAIVNEYSFEEAVRMAVLAGADLLCISNNGSNTYDPDAAARAAAVIRGMVSDGDVTPERVRQSANKVRALAAKLQK